MMDNEVQLRIQAFLDGELSRDEARLMEAQLARDPEARALAEELSGTAKVLAGYEEGVKLPETREFFWSKIERQLQREQARPAVASPSRAWFGWRQWLATSGALAVILLIALSSGHPRLLPAAFAEVADPGAFIYRDSTNHTTLVWLSYPADNEVADND